MASLGLMPTDYTNRRRFRRSRHKKTKERGGCFTIMAQNTLSMLDVKYNPDVNYSLKKKGRWKLLHEVKNDPAAVFDESTIPVEVAVCPRRRKNSKQILSNHFYHQGPGRSFEIKDSSGKRHKGINTRSMLKLMDSKCPEEMKKTHAQVVILESEQGPVQQQHLPDPFINGRRCVRKHHRKAQLTDFMNEMVDEVLLNDESESDGEIFSEEETNEELWRDQTQCLGSFFNHLNLWTSTSDCHEILREFDLLEDSTAPQYKDKVNIHPEIIHLPEIVLSSEQLKETYDEAYIEGPLFSFTCAINISEMIKSEIQPREGISKHHHYQAYVILEKFGESLSVRLNCHVNTDIVEDIYPPNLQDATTVVEIIDRCIMKCSNDYRSALVYEKSPEVLQVSGYSVPLNDDLRMEFVSIDSVLPNKHQKSTVDGQINNQNTDCAICFDTLLPGRYFVPSYCAHAFCETCWTQHLLSQIKAGRQHLRCAAFECKKRIDLVTKLRHLSVNVLREHHNRAMLTTLQSQDEFMWCPNSTCSRPMRLMNISQVRQESPEMPVNVRCSCNTSFCSECRQEAHWPVSCEMYHLFIANLRRKEEDKKRKIRQKPLKVEPLEVLTKPCPKCKTQWEKSGGCDSMKCSICSIRFCWYCGMKSVGHVPCNRSILEMKHKLHIFREPKRVQKLSSVQSKILLVKNTNLEILKKCHLRLLKRAMLGTGESFSFNMEKEIMSLLKTVSECARVSQFIGVAAISERNDDKKKKLNTLSDDIYGISSTALIALRSLSAHEVLETRRLAISQLRDCQAKAHGISFDMLMLKA